MKFNLGESEMSDELLEETRAVKMLLVLQAMAIGCQQKQIAAALNVSEATLSRMLPKGFAKEMTKIAERRVNGGAGA